MKHRSTVRWTALALSLSLSLLALVWHNPAQTQPLYQQSVKALPATETPPIQPPVEAFAPETLIIPPDFLTPHTDTPVFVPNTDTPTPIPAPRVEASFVWTMIPRFPRSYPAYSPADYSYDPAYVNPSGWQVNFSACDSVAENTNIVRYTWNFTGVDVDGFDEERTTRNCTLDRLTDPSVPLQRCTLRPPDLELDCPDLPDVNTDELAPLFPEDGRYRVTLTVEGARGSTDSHTETIEVKDYLIVAMGDSNAAGEGNPDSEFDVDLTWNPLDLFVEFEPPEWWDARCHRSLTSGPVIAASRIEAADPHSSVTFFSYACSGAGIRNGLTSSYGGIDNPNDLPDLPPQVDAVAAALCGRTVCWEPEDRQIDAVFMSVGINDLGFSGVVIDCAFDITGACRDDFDADLQQSLSRLDGRFAIFNQQLHDQLNVADVFITEFPVELLTDDGCDEDCADNGVDYEGCGVFEGIDDADAEWLTGVGYQLNDRVRAAADVHGWHYVGGIVEAFDDHGYCSDSSWYVAFNESVLGQLDRKGTVHPNRFGHQATARQLVSSFEQNAIDESPENPVRSITITFEEVRIVDHGVPVLTEETVFTPESIPTRLRIEVNDQFFNFPPDGPGTFPNGEWVDLPDDFSANFALQGGRILILASAELPGGSIIHPNPNIDTEIQFPPRNLRLSASHRYDDFDEGSHTVTSSTDSGFFELRYRVNVE